MSIERTGGDDHGPGRYGAQRGTRLTITLPGVQQERAAPLGGPDCGVRPEDRPPGSHLPPQPPVEFVEFAPRVQRRITGFGR